MNSSPSPRSVTLCFLVALLALPSALAAGPDTGKPAYTLFMGADIELEQGKELYRVEGVSGSYFKIRVNGKEQLISTQDGKSRMRVDNSLKLAGAPIVLENLTTERAYTLARDPIRKLSNLRGMASSASLESDLSGPAIDNAALALRTAQADDHAPPDLVPTMQAAYNSAVQGQGNAFNGMNSEINTTGTLAENAQAEIAEENYDAIAVSLELSSPVRLDDPYVLVIARIHERGEKPDLFRNWIFAQKLDPIDSKSRKVHINQGGLPVGFELVDCQVRLYNHGHEVPTSVSPKRVDLTRDEARQYVLIEHLTAHKSDTVDAAPAFASPPADLRDRIAAGDFQKPYYVKIDADGNAQGVFTDRTCSSPLSDAYVNALMADILFAPALDKGKPVAGVARVQLGTLLN